MKKSFQSYCLTMIFILLLSLMLNSTAFADIHTITFICCSYTPDQLSAAVGDTIQWSGDFTFHPMSSTTIPVGAQSWNVTTGMFFQYIVSIPGMYNYQCDNHFLFGMIGSFTASVTDVNDKGETTQPFTFKLEQNHPNPFNPATTIRFSLPSSERVTLRILDMLGNEVATLLNETKSPGHYEIQFEGSTLASGIYFYKLETKKFIAIRKMLLLK